MPKDSRASMVRSAASLIGSQGVTATSFSEVLADSGAPRGSIYHHFPEGKNQLARDAIRWTSDRVLAYQGAVTPSTPAQVLERFIGMWRQVVVTSGGGSGCVVAGVAVDTNRETRSADDEGLITVVRDTFRSWIALLASQLEAVGIAADQATAIARTTLAGMEGALILCRAEGDVQPLETVATQLMRLLPPATHSP
ncbi:MAG TPA: TetR/AcrR family transcriptional regulator [Acidothermaceae bacterium]|jgi:AcrR family transcriptional regulator